MQNQILKDQYSMSFSLALQVYQTLEWLFLKKSELDEIGRLFLNFILIPD